MLCLERIAEGDSQAMSDLFLRYARVVHSVGRRILRDGEEAEDLFQEVFLYIHRKSNLFDSAKSSARSWVFQIAYTQAFLRRRQLKARGFYAAGIADRSLETDPRRGREQNTIRRSKDHSEGMAGGRYLTLLLRSNVRR